MPSCRTLTGGLPASACCCNNLRRRYGKPHGGFRAGSACSSVRPDAAPHGLELCRSPELKETAKATQEAAKTAGKAIDELRGFFSRIFGGSLEQLAGIGEDQLTVYRRTRQLRLAKRYEEIRKEMGFDGKIKQVEFKFGLPLTAAASIERFC